MYIYCSHYRFDMSVDEAIELGKRAITHAAHRDAYSGGINNVYHVCESGWRKVWSNDTNDMYYSYYPIKQKTIASEAGGEEKASS